MEIEQCYNNMKYNFYLKIYRKLCYRVVCQKVIFGCIFFFFVYRLQKVCIKRIIILWNIKKNNNVVGFFVCIFDQRLVI